MKIEGDLHESLELLPQVKDGYYYSSLRNKRKFLISLVTDSADSANALCESDPSVAIVFADGNLIIVADVKGEKCG